MTKFNLNDFTRGWLVGNFDPSILKTDACEVAVKRYEAGDTEESHYHKLADEITIVVDGAISMNDEVLMTNDIVLVKKGEAVKFLALADSTLCVIKVPFARDDKYIV
jgi:hypothetical protein